MRIDSCRKCGLKLKPKQHCSICKDAITFKCNNCRIETDEQIHQNCILIENNQKVAYPSVA